jgi:hypothetical protein
MRGSQFEPALAAKRPVDAAGFGHDARHMPPELALKSV